MAKVEEISYQIDLDKVKTVKDCVGVMKVMMCGMSVNGDMPTIHIYSSSPFYEELKHLAKENV